MLKHSCWYTILIKKVNLLEKIVSLDFFPLVKVAINVKQFSPYSEDQICAMWWLRSLLHKMVRLLGSFLLWAERRTRRNHHSAENEGCCWKGLHVPDSPTISAVLPSSKRASPFSPSLLQYKIHTHFQINFFLLPNVLQPVYAPPFKYLEPPPHRAQPQTHWLFPQKCCHEFKPFITVRQDWVELVDGEQLRTQTSLEFSLQLIRS